MVSLGYFVLYKPARPDEVLARSLLRTIQLQSARFEFSGTSSTQSYGLAGSSTAQGTFDANGYYKTQSGTIRLEARSVNGQQTYIKPIGLSSLSSVFGPQAAQYGISPTANPFARLDGNWLVITNESKNALLKNTRADITSSATTLSNKEKRSVARAYQRYPFVSVTKVLTDQKIQLTPSRHYKARIDKNTLAAFAKDIEYTVPALKLNDQKVASLQSASFSTVISQPFDIWIARDSGYIKQIKTTDPAGNDEIQLVLAQYNQPVRVIPPQNARPLFEALSDVLLGR